MPTRPTRPNRLGDPDADAPEWWRRSANLRKVPIIGVVVLVILILRAGAGSSPPSIRTSCTTPAFVLSTTHTQVRHALAWTVTGPPGMRYLLTVGASGFVTSGGRLHATPDPGLSKDQMQAASQRMTMDGDCKQSGHFAVFIGAGTYQVRLFRLGGTTAIPTATEADAMTLTVDPA
jgi:hypothetical protein